MTIKIDPNEKAINLLWLYGAGEHVKVKAQWYHQFTEGDVVEVISAEPNEFGVVVYQTARVSDGVRQKLMNTAIHGKVGL